MQNINRESNSGQFNFLSSGKMLLDNPMFSIGSGCIFSIQSCKLVTRSTVFDFHSRFFGLFFHRLKIILKKIIFTTWG